MKIDTTTLFNRVFASWDDSFHMYDLLSNNDLFMLPTLMVEHYIKEHAFFVLSYKFFNTLDEVIYKMPTSKYDFDTYLSLNIRCQSLSFKKVEITELDVITIDLEFDCYSLIQGTTEKRKDLLLDLVLRAIMILEHEFKTELITMREILSIVGEKVSKEKPLFLY